MKMSFSSENLANYWDNIAKNMNELEFQNAPSTLIYKQSEINLFKRHFKEAKGKKLLKLDLWNEVNNTGILFWAYDQGYEVHGLDISPYIVRRANENFAGKEHTFIESDIRDIKFPDNTFDYIYTMGTIEHIPDYRKAIKEIYRVLKPGGKAIIGVPNANDPFLRPLTVWILERFNAYPYSPEKAFIMDELATDAEEAGFTLMDTTGVLFQPGWLRMADCFFYNKLPFLRGLFNLLFKPFEAMERKYDNCKRMGYLIAVVVEK
jgi:SAM-dependent methyltransferase